MGVWKYHSSRFIILFLVLLVCSFVRLLFLSRVLDFPEGKKNPIEIETLNIPLNFFSLLSLSGGKMERSDSTFIIKR